MAIGKRTEGYAGSGHQSTTDGSTVTICTVEVPEHHHGVAEVAYICREKAGGGGDACAWVMWCTCYRDGASATYLGRLENDGATDMAYDSGGAIAAPIIDCTGTTLRVRVTGLAGHNLEHSVFVRWLALAEYTT